MVLIIVVGYQTFDVFIDTLLNIFIHYCLIGYQTFDIVLKKLIAG